jgi:hypothetical protein
MPAAAERRRSPRDPGAFAIGINLVRFTVALAGVATAVVRESRGTADPITLEPRVLGRPVESPELARVS